MTNLNDFIASTDAVSGLREVQKSVEVGKRDPLEERLQAMEKALDQLESRSDNLENELNDLRGSFEGHWHDLDNIELEVDVSVSRVTGDTDIARN